MALRQFPARTKLAVPELPSMHVARPGLTARLNDSVAEFAVTFVAGFAGSGKTVGLAEWARSRPAGTVAWLSCDITDADPIHFWTALIAALRTLDPDIGDDALDLLDSDGHLGYDAVASIVNDLVDRRYRARAGDRRPPLRRPLGAGISGRSCRSPSVEHPGHPQRALRSAPAAAPLARRPAASARSAPPSSG